jgi:hypothetical protein
MVRGNIFLIGLILYLIIAGAFLVFFYGLVGIVFRTLLGVDLPDPFHWFS